MPNSLASSGGHSISGAYVTYTAPASLPAPPDDNFVIITAQQPGTMGGAAGPPSTTTVVPYMVQNNNQIPSGDQTAGANFVFRLRGFTSSGGFAYGIIGRFHVDNTDTNITSGVEDINIAQPGGTSVVYTEVAFTGTFNMVNSSNGTMSLTVTSPPWTVAPIPANPPPSMMTFAFTLDDNVGTGKIIEAEPTGNYVGSGMLQFQVPVTFTSTNLAGSYVFSLATPTGTGSSGTHFGAIGRLDLGVGANTAMGAVASTSTVDDASGNPTQSLTGSYVLDGPTGDHGTLTLTTSSSTTHSTFYVASKRLIWALGSDPDTVANNRGVLLGAARKIAVNATSGQQFTFDNTSLNGPFVFTALGETTSAAANGQGHSSAMIGRFSGTAGAAGTGNLAGIFDINDGGTVPAGPLNILGGSGFTIRTDGRGRGVLNISSNASGSAVTYHFVFYLVSPGFGFLQEQPASDGSKRGRTGLFLFQTVTAPIALPPINLTFEGGTTADTAASLHSVAVLQVNGAASPVSFTGTADDSQSGVPSQVPATGTTGAITISDPTNGRGTVTATAGTIAGSSGAVIYVEDPSEVLVMGTDATLVEPQIITLDQ